MRPVSAAAALLALATGASSQLVVQFNVTRGIPGVHVGAVPAALGRRRRDTYGERLVNSIAGGGYFAEVQVGNPPQNVTMLLDTGSSDAWVLGREADLCTDRDLQDVYGTACVDTFDPANSSTYREVDAGGFRIVYLDGGTASGDYFTDDFRIGGATLKALQMAHVTRAVRGTGILGLGYNASERAETKYPNVMDEMVNQGLIDCKAFSLYLNDRRADSGAILFGGIDTDKFIGPLQVLPLHSPAGGANFSSFEVNFTSVAVTFSNGSVLDVSTATLDHPAPAVLDSGTTLSYLPDEMAQRIYAALGAVYDPDLAMTLIDCRYLTDEPDLKLTFFFTGTSPSTSTAHAMITVPIWEMVLDILPSYYASSAMTTASSSSSSSSSSDSDSDSDSSSSSSSSTTTSKTDPPTQPLSRACVFGIQSTALFEETGTVRQSNFTLLGDTFLRSAYVVYDMTHHQVGLAQANLNSTASTIVELSAAAPGLPRVVGVAAQQTTFTPTPTFSTLPGLGAGAGATSSGNAAPPAPGRPASLLLHGGEVLRLALVTGSLTILGGALIAL